MSAGLQLRDSSNPSGTSGNRPYGDAMGVPVKAADGSTLLALATTPAPLGTAANTSQAASAAEIELIVANPQRRALTIFNASIETLYIGPTSAVSTTAYSYQVAPNALFTLPVAYTGALYGIWAGADASGTAQITEYS
jgi:hypothetical protein